MSQQSDLATSSTGLSKQSTHPKPESYPVWIVGGPSVELKKKNSTARRKETEKPSSFWPTLALLIYTLIYLFLCTEKHEKYV